MAHLEFILVLSISILNFQSQKNQEILIEYEFGQALHIATLTLHKSSKEIIVSATGSNIEFANVCKESERIIY